MKSVYRYAQSWVRLVTGPRTWRRDLALVAVGAAIAVSRGPTIVPIPNWSLAPAYVSLGAIMFLCSIWATTHSPRDHMLGTLAAIRDSAPAQQVSTAGRALLISVIEETLWRGLFLPTLTPFLGPTVAILVTSVLFTWMHRHRAPVRSPQFAELLGFSVALGGLFHLTGDLLSVVLVHATRNYLLAVRNKP